MLDGTNGVDAGWSPSVQVDAQGVAHVAYVGATRDDLKYITDAPGATTEIIDDGYRIVGTTVDGLPKPEFHFVGDDAGIVMPTGSAPMRRLPGRDDAGAPARHSAAERHVERTTSVAGATRPVAGRVRLLRLEPRSAATDVVMSTLGDQSADRRELGRGLHQAAQRRPVANLRACSRVVIVRACVQPLVLLRPRSSHAPAYRRLRGHRASRPPAHDQLTLTKAKFADLPGWADDHPAEAVPSLPQLVRALAELADAAPVGADGHGGIAKQWRHACAAAAKLKRRRRRRRPRVLRGRVHAVGRRGQGRPDGQAHRLLRPGDARVATKHGAFKYPVYGRPADLVEIDLTPFIRDAHARRIWGRLDGDRRGRPVLHARGDPQGRAREQGARDHVRRQSGRRAVRAHRGLGEGGDGRRHDASGSSSPARTAARTRASAPLLKGMASCTPGDGTMPGIRKWFDDHPARFDEIVDQNASYVFFKESKQPGAVGSQKVILTPRRSMAIDRAFIAHVDADLGRRAARRTSASPAPSPWQHLLIAQDTGGGILGAVRGDIYWGDDPRPRSSAAGWAARAATGCCCPAA